MVDWLVICNGGPNDTTVGTRRNSLAKACTTLNNMMKALNADIGQVQRVQKGQELIDCFRVDSEGEAGKTVRHCQRPR